MFEFRISLCPNWTEDISLQCPNYEFEEGYLSGRKEGGGGRRNLETIRATVNKLSDVGGGGVHGLSRGQTLNSLQTGFIEPRKTNLDSPPEQVQLLGCH